MAGVDSGTEFESVIPKSQYGDNYDDYLVNYGNPDYANESVTGETLAEIPREYLEEIDNDLRVKVIEANQTIYKDFKKVGVEPFYRLRYVPLYGKSVKGFRRGAVYVEESPNLAREYAKATVSFELWLKENHPKHWRKWRKRFASKIDADGKNLLKILEMAERDPKSPTPRWLKTYRREWRKEYPQLSQTKHKQVLIKLQLTRKENKEKTNARFKILINQTGEGKGEPAGGKHKIIFQELRAVEGADMAKFIAEQDVGYISDTNIKRYLGSPDSNEMVKQSFRTVMRDITGYASSIIIGGIGNPYGNFGLQTESDAGRSLSKYFHKNKRRDKLLNYQPDFPNIERIKNWWLTKGFRQANQETLDRLVAARSLTTSANILDRIVFLIANGVFAKQTGTYDRPVYKGKAKSIKVARRFKGQPSSEYRRSLKNRRKRKYEVKTDWRNDLRSDSHGRNRNIKNIRRHRDNRGSM